MPNLPPGPTTQAILLPETRAALEAAPADAGCLWCTAYGWIGILVDSDPLRTIQGDQSCRTLKRVGPPAACIAAFDQKGTA